MIGDDRSATFMAHVGEPWVVTEPPGNASRLSSRDKARGPSLSEPTRTREPAGPRRSAQAPCRVASGHFAGYIDALRRGEPNYGEMTPEVAAYTRRQLVLNQAILAKLGALRATLFRGVTTNGNDLYFVHFVNGSAEWRIGLVKEGKIGRLGLGP